MCGGRVVKKVHRHPEYTAKPSGTSECVLKWSGKLPSGKVFQPLRRQTLRLDEPSLAPPGWWKACLCDVGGDAGMGEGETSEFTLPADLAYGAEGDARLGVPPDSPVVVKLSLLQFSQFEDISAEKDGRAVRKVTRRGTGEGTPHKGDEVCCKFWVGSADGQVHQEKERVSFVLGQMGERQRSAMRLLSHGAYADQALGLMLHRMHVGEVCELRCQPSFVGGTEQGRTWPTPTPCTFR